MRSSLFASITWNIQIEIPRTVWWIPCLDRWELDLRCCVGCQLGGYTWEDVWFEERVEYLFCRMWVHGNLLCWCLELHPWTGPSPPSRRLQNLRRVSRCAHGCNCNHWNSIRWVNHFSGRLFPKRDILAKVVHATVHHQCRLDSNFVPIWYLEQIKGQLLKVSQLKLLIGHPTFCVYILIHSMQLFCIIIKWSSQCYVAF